ncbi:MAG TPA: hypothetical protein VGS28_00385 [Candidatus Saccharimonadales bacterium]|nr:hypothetical protein [Candidatus Saccharimonadales bacterium]
MDEQPQLGSGAPRGPTPGTKLATDVTKAPSVSGSVTPIFARSGLSPSDSPDPPIALETPVDPLPPPAEEDSPSIHESAIPHPLRNQLLVRMIGFGLLAVAILIVGTLLLIKATNHYVVQNNSLSAVNLPLNHLPNAAAASSSSSNQSVSVNGTLRVSNTVVVEPGSKPSKPTAGQIYYNEASNVLEYYNGVGFEVLQGSGQGSGSGATSVPATIVVQNITNGSGGNVSAVGATTGNLPLFNGSTIIGNSLITQSGNNLSTGTGVESVTIGSTSGSSATTIQGGTGNVAVLTGSVAGTSGTVTIQSGDSQGGSAGNVVVDTGGNIVNGVVVDDKTFEDGLDNMVDGFGFADTLTQSTAEAHSGAKSLSVTVGNGGAGFEIGEGAQSPPFTTPGTSGHRYLFSAWVRAGTTSSNIQAFVDFSNDGYAGGGTIANEQWGSGTDSSSGWTNITGTLTAPPGTVALGLQFTGTASATGVVHYFDDITVTDLSSSTSTAALSLGATNAQQITIGNVNETGPTTIDGGSGISINANLGTLTESGGPVSITGGGNVSIGANGTGAFNANGGLTLGSGNGALSILSAGETGTSGAISIESGSSSAGTAGNVTFDTGSSVVSGTVVNDKTFEPGFSDSCGTTYDMEAWFNTSVANSNAQAHSGAQSLAITQQASSTTGVIQNDNCAGVPVVPGHHYSFTAWWKANTTPDLVSGTVNWGGYGGATSSFSTVTDTTTGWTEMSGTAVAPAGTTTAFYTFNGSNIGAGDIQYLDDIVMTDLSSSSSTAVLNLGNTNAQEVNLGNSNEIQATSIYGGSGIQLLAGVGTVSVSGGAFSITGTATSTISLGQAGSGAGANLTINAGEGAGGNNNGGNLVLEGGAATGSGTGGGVVVEPLTNSTTAFTIENASTVPLFTADTTNSIISVVGTSSAFATLNLSNAHFESTQTTPPTIGIATCVGAQAVTAGSTDSAGSFTTGTLTTGGNCVITLTFNKPYGTAPKSVIIAPMNSSAADTSAAGPQPYVSSTGTGNFVITFKTSVGTGSAYQYYYWVIE